MSAQPLTLFGIPNCDTVKKARKWLETHNLSYQFQDIRQTPLTLEQLQGWSAQVGWTALFNKRSTSYRALDDATKASLDEETALALILETPTLMKRPVVETGSELLVGFQAKTYQSLLES